LSIGDCRFVIEHAAGRFEVAPIAPIASGR
jgi:hypothetical protein